MPKVAKELGALAVSKLKEPGMHPVGKVAGLYLQVLGPVSRSWILRVKVGEKRREIGLGSYPAVSLKEAQTKAQGERDKISAGIDPILQRREAASNLRANQALEMTFEAAAKRFMDAKSSEWKNPKHGDQWRNTLETYAYPLIGRLYVRHIGREHVMQVLEPIWLTKNETASRLRGRIEAILNWGKVKGYRAGENPAAWRGNLENLLSKPSKVQKVRNHPALPISEIGEFMPRLRAIDANGARCLDFAILTAARSGEARGACFSEIDWDANVWRVPAERMKAKKEHRVPLSAAAVTLLKSMPQSKDHDVIFPSPRGKVLSDMTLLMMVRRLGVAAVPHGFRSTFRDWAGERTNYPRELAEVALAHVKGDATEAAYWRSDVLEKRRRMMDDWAQFIAVPTPKGAVLPLHRQA
ncbi:tyrosine-type recombinase/integrase [Paraburkholderia madseniana]|uniref:tyrosine-type recombinase/integrase n=1 Tax=Paraburkholderia madseniana TaxID=2599607 RepID=UPI0015C52AF8|nr:integrase arm-type DNA-binding domain-containing protein [Paraburkholderia madseniana]NPT68087.1 tyrosine-type recombinase/integrase [Paraburkholderia madseniana]